MKEPFDESKYIEIEYVNKGRDFNGVDCWGLVYLIYKLEYGIELLSLSKAYENAAEGIKIQEIVLAGKSLIPNKKKESPEYGDVVLFTLKGHPCHVGIYIGANKVLHILEDTFVTCESLNSYRLKGNVEGYYEIL